MKRPTRSPEAGDWGFLRRNRELELLQWLHPLHCCKLIRVCYECVCV
ncbi:hypothetical protein HanPSC8_Chr10g0448891 [Helianthus annuus]|nr:hypothetical protein HanPSC8_Chr10g0448891 [Helianthus annuus]